MTITTDADNTAAEGAAIQRFLRSVMPMACMTTTMTPCTIPPSQPYMQIAIGFGLTSRGDFITDVGSFPHLSMKYREADTRTEPSPELSSVAPPSRIPIMAEIEEHFAFLKSASSDQDDPQITVATEAMARHVWWLFWQASGQRLPVPAACTGSDGRLLYSWDNGRHHLEFEIIPNEPSEIFYRDRLTGQCWVHEHTLGDRLPSSVVGALANFS